MKKFFIILIFLDLILILYLFLNREYLKLLNTQIALIASIFVTGGSFLGYRKLILKRAKNYENIDDRDLLEKIEDPYGLYEENSNQNLSAKELFQEEKQKIKGFKKGVFNFISTSSAFLSIYRVFGYLFLIISVLFLIDKKIFYPIHYFLGLSLVPLSAMIFMFVKK